MEIDRAYGNPETKCIPATMTRCLSLVFILGAFASGERRVKGGEWGTKSGERGARKTMLIEPENSGNKTFFTTPKPFNFQD